MTCSWVAMARNAGCWLAARSSSASASAAPGSESTKADGTRSANVRTPWTVWTCSPESSSSRVHHFENAVAQHRVGARLPRDGQQLGGVALHPADPVLHALVTRAALQRGQRVGTRVDHGDGVTLDGERHREPAGPATDVDDLQRTRPPGPGERHPERLGDQRGTHRTTAPVDHARFLPMGR